MQFMPRKQEGNVGKAEAKNYSKMLASNLPSERAACGNCAQLVFVCVCVSECLCAYMCPCVRVCAKGLLVFADLLTRCVMLFGFCHCIHLGAHVRRSRAEQRRAEAGTAGRLCLPTRFWSRPCLRANVYKCLASSDSARLRHRLPGCRWKWRWRCTAAAFEYFNMI